MKPTKVASSLYTRFWSPEEGEVILAKDGSEIVSPAIDLRAAQRAMGFAHSKRVAIAKEVKKLRFFLSKGVKLESGGIATSLNNLASIFTPQYAAKMDALKKAEAALAFAILVEETCAVTLNRIDLAHDAKLAVFTATVAEHAA